MKFPSFRKKHQTSQTEEGEEDRAATTVTESPIHQTGQAEETAVAQAQPEQATPTSPEAVVSAEQPRSNPPVAPVAGPQVAARASTQQTTLPMNPMVAPPPRQRKSGYNFGFSSKPKRRSALAPPEEVIGQRAVERSQKRGRLGQKGRRPDARGVTAAELVKIEGQKVLIPTYEDIVKYGSVIYPVKEPYQFVNLRIDNGEMIYTAIEPQLGPAEQKVMKKAAEAFDMLVNVGTVLTTVEDKLQFLEETFRDIVRIYNLKLNETEYKRLLYHIERDYIGYGKIDTLVRDRLIEDISCNGPGSPIFIFHRFFESIRTNVVFEEVELNNFILRLAQLSGRHISILQPIRDAALPDGSRINMTLGKEVTKKGSTFTIRKFRSEPISPIEIMMLHSGDPKIFAYFWMLIEYGRSLLISGGTAAGKSVPYQEKVLVYRSGKHSLVPIGELYDELASSERARTIGGHKPYEVLDCEDIETAAFGPDLKARRFPVRSVVRHPSDKLVYRVKTRSGRTVNTTADHSLFTITNGAAVPYPVSHLSAGMYVAVPRMIPEPTAPAKPINLLELFSSEDYGLYAENVAGLARDASATIGEDETAKLLGIQKRMLRAGLKKGFLAVRVNRLSKLTERTGVMANPGELRIRAKTVRKHGISAALPITKSLMRFMGYWTAEGMYHNGLTLFQVDEETKNDMKRAGREAFNLPAHDHATDKMRFEFKYAVLQALFKRFFGPGKGAGAKTIPDIVLEQSNDLLAEFLQAYFTGDGHAWRQVEASTKSHELADRLLYSLGRFGIVASRRPRVMNGQTYHLVTVYGQRNLQIFEEKIGFFNRKGKEALAKFAHRKMAPHTNVDVIPGISGLLKEVLMFKTGQPKKELWSDWHSYWSPTKTKNMSRQTVGAFVEDSGAQGDVRDRLLNLAYSDIFWDEVEEVEPIEYDGNYVYDLEVPGAQNFVGGEGGVFLHNTTLLNAISMLIKPENKIVSVEDTPEINLAHPNWIQAVTRVGFGEGGGGVSGVSVSGISGISHGSKSAGDISLFDLLISALRQRPDFIIVGEVRGEEAYTLFQAIAVGHATMGTIHAASMTELIARVESQPMNVPRVMVANLDLVIFVGAMRRGEEKVRRIKEIVEVLGVNPSTKELITNTIFTWNPVSDTYEFNGRSFLIEKISKTYGIPMEKLDAELDNRVRLLERMIAEGVTNYRAVSDLVRKYYVDKDAVARADRLEALLTPEEAAADVKWGDPTRETRKK